MPGELVQENMSLSGKDRVVALVPARAGSKGIPRKNLKVVGGRTLVEWAVIVAQRCTRIEEVFVSTDDNEVADLSETLKASVIWRPSEMADDNAPMSAVLSNALDTISDFGSLCLLEPTSPLRYPTEVDGVLKLLGQHPNSVIATVHAAREAPELIYTMDGEGSMGQVWEGPRFGRRQDRPDYYMLNGLVYAATKETLLRSTDLREHPLYGLKTETERSISIDTATDLDRVSAWLSLYPAFPELLVE